MQFSVVALFIGAALATPTTLSAKLAARDSVCGGTLYGTPTCCGLDVLGLIDVNCKNRTFCIYSFVVSLFFSFIRIG